MPDHRAIFDEELKDIPLSVMKISERCPTTGEHVITTEQKQFSTAHGKAIWWRCPSCDGWHALILEEKS